VIKVIFGHGAFDLHILNFGAEEKPSLKQILDTDPLKMLKANFSIGGSWNPDGNVVILQEGDGFYVIVNNDSQMKVRVKDLQSGDTRTLVANSKNPGIEAEGNNVAVRLLSVKSPNGSYSY
jgi:hypothetical protein|tara:strand:+ start:403 stop:765 length:363 start_codon:yes stop_codon:yes gene_type:complete